MITGGSLNTADDLHSYLKDMFKYALKSITVDNGSEFLNDTGMETSLFSKNLKRTRIYYAYPYCSWESGSNEHSNGMISRFVPKGYLISL